MADNIPSSEPGRRNILKHPLLLTVIGAVIVGGFSMYSTEIKTSINNFFSSALVLTGVGLAIFSVASDIILYLILRK